MAFDSEAFLAAKFIPRTGKVPVEALRDFFDKGEKPVWTVRSLTGQELGVANAAFENAKNMAAIVEAIQGRYADKVKGFKEIIGLSEDAPPDIIKRIEMILIGSVKPNLKEDIPEDKRMGVILKILEVAPIEFYMITNEITKLTGQGHIVGKPKPSGTKKKSSIA